MSKDNQTPEAAEVSPDDPLMLEANASSKLLMEAAGLTPESLMTWGLSIHRRAIESDLAWYQQEYHRLMKKCRDAEEAALEFNEVTLGLKVELINEKTGEVVAEVEQPGMPLAKFQTDALKIGGALLRLPEVQRLVDGVDAHGRIKGTRINTKNRITKAFNERLVRIKAHIQRYAREDDRLSEADRTYQASVVEQQREGISRAREQKMAALANAKPGTAGSYSEDL